MTVLAGPAYLLTKTVVGKLDEQSAPSIADSGNDDVVRLPDRSTILVRQNSTGHRVLNWLKLENGGEHAIHVGNHNFAAASTSLTRDGWQQLVQFAQILKGHRGLSATILFAAHHSDPGTLQLEQARADRIRLELLRQGAREEQVSVAPEQVGPGQAAPDEEGLRVLVVKRD